MTVFYFKKIVEPKAEVLFEHEAEDDGTNIILFINYSFCNLQNINLLFITR